MDSNEIVFRVGDKIIYADGTFGRVAYVDGNMVSIHCEDGTVDEICADDFAEGEFYLIGRKVLGNKVEKESLESEVKYLQEQRDKLNEKIDTLRKHIWRWENQMVPDWKERQQKTFAEQKTKQKEKATD